MHAPARLGILLVWLFAATVWAADDWAADCPFAEPSAAWLDWAEIVDGPVAAADSIRVEATW